MDWRNKPYRLSFLCRDREETFKDKPYNEEGKFMSIEHNMWG